MPSALTVEQIFSLIDSLDPTQLAQAVREANKDPAVSAQIQDRYGSLLEALGGKTMKALASLPSKWGSLDNARKVAILRAWPTGMPFVSDTLDLRAKLRVDR